MCGLERPFGSRVSNPSNCLGTSCWILTRRIGPAATLSASFTTLRASKYLHSLPFQLSGSLCLNLEYFDHPLISVCNVVHIPESSRIISTVLPIYETLRCVRRMSALSNNTGMRKETEQKPPLDISNTIINFGNGTYTAPAPVSGAPQNPYAVYQHIQDMSAKRISTLDYLRKA